MMLWESDLVIWGARRYSVRAVTLHGISRCLGANTLPLFDVGKAYKWKCSRNSQDSDWMLQSCLSTLINKMRHGVLPVTLLVVTLQMHPDLQAHVQAYAQERPERTADPPTTETDLDNRVKQGFEGDPQSLTDS
eukprot:1160629-Pelagomonas_calceolata.AAC.4